MPFPNKLLANFYFLIPSYFYIEIVHHRGMMAIEHIIRMKKGKPLSILILYGRASS